MRLSLLVIITLGSLLVSGCQNAPSIVAQPKVAQFRAMSFNIHHGEGPDGKLDLERIAEVINSHGADLVALQEVDRGADRTRGIDMPAELARLTGMTSVFSNNFAIEGGEYGNAVLSRFPIVSWTNYYLPKVRATEQRGLLEVVIQLPNDQRLRFLATHLDHRSEVDRLAGVQQIRATIISGTPMPLIAAGDFNADPKSETYRRLGAVLQDAWVAVGYGDGFTIPVDKPTRRIDYIWFSGGMGLRPVSARVISSDSSDHLPLIVDFELK